MKLRGIIQTNAICIPKIALLVGCAIELDKTFLNSYSGIEEGTEKSTVVLGFNHDIVDFYCNRFHEYDMIFPLWQNKYKRLTESFEIARIHYEGSAEAMIIEGDNVWKSCPFDHVGHCNAFVFWIDYYLPVEDGLKIMSTGDRFHHQAIRMLPTPFAVDQDKIFRVSFNLSTEDLKDYNWKFNKSRQVIENEMIKSLLIQIKE